MTRPGSASFQGFTKKTVGFLRELQSHNEKAWFEAHREEYEQYLLDPFRRLVMEMTAPMLAIDSGFEITPAVNKTISRIYRDTRFSKDKSPFKGSMWLTFKRPSGDWKEAPAYFFEITTELYQYGMGFYSASRETMDLLREEILRKPDRFRKLISFYPRQKTFLMGGEEYKRILNESVNPDLREWYQLKNLYFISVKKFNDNLFSKKIVRELVAGFETLAPMYHFLLELSRGDKRR